MKILLKTHQKLKKNVKKPVISKMLEQKGKLFYKLADDFCGNTEWETEREHEIEVEKVFIKGHKQAITSLNWA